MVAGEHAWWKFPGLRRVVASVGVVDGTQANADRLLYARDELLLVLPGGLRESMKPRELRYRLLWGHRYGFVRTAIANGAPVVARVRGGRLAPILDLVGNPFDRGKRWLGRFAFPIPRPWAGVPIVHRVALRYAIGNPIHLSATPEEADNPRVLRRCRHEIAGALHDHRRGAGAARGLRRGRGARHARPRRGARRPELQRPDRARRRTAAPRGVIATGVAFS